MRRPGVPLGLCAAGLIGLTAAGLALHIPGQLGIGSDRRLRVFVALCCVAGLIYAAAVALVLRGRLPRRALWLILGSAAVLRAMVLVAPPYLSTDLYRYVWDGKVQAAGINPYRYIPDDPHLAFLRDRTIFPGINRASYARTIYPPAAEAIFFLATRISPTLLGMKAAMTALEAVAIWAMLGLLDRAGLPRTRVLIYAWNPLPIWEFAGNGHVDAIAVCFVALVLLAGAGGRRGLSAAALAGAVLAKFLPAVLLPALWRRWDWRFAAIFAGLIALLYLPYLSAGRLVFGFLGGYAAQEGIDSGRGIFALFALGHLVKLPVVAGRLYLVALALLLAGMGAAMVFGPSAPANPLAATRLMARRALLLGSVLTVGLSPHYSWYFCWLLVPACIVPWPSVLYLVSAAILLYLDPIHTKLLWPALVYGPFAVLAARDAWKPAGAGALPAPPQAAERRA
ncbi:MAG TPA: hypothetical protein VMU82_03330 [Acetobacteraceae bacterium]|nr:hypothetical protein [Acetobacteraceae bacterium]